VGVTSRPGQPRQESSEDTALSSVPLWESPADVDLSLFPSTRYRGSKRKIIPWLWSHFRQLDFSSALDVFGGTGSVSYLLKRMGKQVTYNDYLQFNHLVGLALIENDRIVLSQSDIDAALDPVPTPPRSFVRDTFKGVYFTDRENKWIDNVVARISSLKGEPSALAYKRALLHYALFQSCLIKRPFNLFHRRNLYLRIANVKRQFGNKSSWDKSFGRRFAAFCAEANRSVFEGAKTCRAMRHNALDIPDKSYDLVYIDPPYLTKAGDNETSDYRRSYHFLEGLCDYDRWDELIDYETPNFRMKQLCHNDWGDTEKNGKAFDALFEKFRRSILVVSYKKFGVPSIDTLIRVFKRHGRRVQSWSRHYKYALNHQNGDAKLNREVLFISE